MNNKKSNYGIFSQVSFINEVSMAETIVTFGLVTALAVSASIIDTIRERKRKKKEDTARLEEQKKEAEKRKKQEEKFIEDCKKIYSIDDISPKLEPGLFTSEKSVFESMIKDIKKWSRLMVNSNAFKVHVQELMKDQEQIDWIFVAYTKQPKPSVSYFKSLISPKEGINGYKESIEIMDGSQEENSEFSWITEDIARMCSIKYDNYLSRGVGTGDGDEGHIYYEISI